MPPPYHFNGLEFKSKEDLYNLNKMKTLKDLALEYNSRTPYLQKIHNIQKNYNFKNYKELCDLLWEKWGGDGVGDDTKKEDNIETILAMYEYESGTPPGSPPKKRFDNITPTPSSDSKNKMIFNFDKSHIDTRIKIDLTPIELVTEDNNFNPKDLLDLVNTDDFCIKIANSLKKLYKEKEQKYKTMQKHTISDSPIINKAFVIRAKSLNKLATEKYNEFNSSENKITFIRKKLIRAITDKNFGIVSITQPNVRQQLCNQIFILSKGYEQFINTFVNMIFSGNQKIELAKKCAYVFQNMGILLSGEVITTFPKDIVEQTDIKSVGVLMKGLENIIFIDDIDSNVKCFESIAKFVHFLNKYPGVSIIMVAGYQKEMDKYFFENNQDIYSRNELVNIFFAEVNKKLENKLFTKEIALYIYNIIVNISNQNQTIFSSQNDMVNLSIIFLNSYYNNKWSKKIQELNNNILIINQVFRQFLINKGFYFEIN